MLYSLCETNKQKKWIKYLEVLRHQKDFEEFC